MNDDIVDHEHGCLYQPPVEVNVVLDGTGPPTVAVIYDLGFVEGNTEPAGTPAHPWQNLLVRLLDIPLPQNGLPILNIGGGDIKAPGETDLWQV